MSIVLKGTGKITESDYHEVKYVGKTLGGQAIEITIHNAINLENIGLAFNDRDNTVDDVTFTGTYDNGCTPSESTEEPWEIKIEGEFEKNCESITVGVGICYIDDESVGLSRGGAEFNSNREYRRIEADGDRGPVKGRITIDEAAPTLRFSSLTFFNKFAKIHSAVEETTVE